MQLINDPLGEQQCIVVLWCQMARGPFGHQTACTNSLLEIKEKGSPR